MNTEDEKTRRELAACLRDKDVYRLLFLFEELRETVGILWPPPLLDGLTLDDIQQLLRDEMARRTAVKGAS